MPFALVLLSDSIQWARIQPTKYGLLQHLNAARLTLIISLATAIVAPFLNVKVLRAVYKIQTAVKTEPAHFLNKMVLGYPHGGNWGRKGHRSSFLWKAVDQLSPSLGQGDCPANGRHQRAETPQRESLEMDGSWFREQNDTNGENGGKEQNSPNFSVFYFSFLKTHTGKVFRVAASFDNDVEITLFKNGGILNYMVRRLL